MKIVLATGIYPPEFGGPATYVRALAEELTKRGEEVKVITYGQIGNGEWEMENDGWPVERVEKGGGPLLRWMRYARALRVHAADADIVYAFSSVSVGVPLMLSRIKTPKRILRLGGDFGWERFTDRGGALGLRTWYGRRSMVSPAFAKATAGRRFWFFVSRWILQSFDHVVFSTEWQRELYERHYRNLPERSVIENAVPPSTPVLHQRHMPFRLLFLGRFVAFKNLLVLIQALKDLPDCTLTLAGEGPMRPGLEREIVRLGLGDRVLLAGPRTGEEKVRLFAEHDVLVLPSLTEISPNVALEARATGLPVLLTEETGLSETLARGMVLCPLATIDEIADAVREIRDGYDLFAEEAASQLPQRGWREVAEEHGALFTEMENGKWKMGNGQLA